MDEGTRLLDRRAAAEARRALDPADESARLEDEVDASRARLGDLVGELERRGRAVKTPAIVIAAAVGVAAVVGAILLRRVRRRSHARLVRDMWRRAAAHPERVAVARPNLAKKILGAAGSAAAATVVKRWLGAARR